MLWLVRGVYAALLAHCAGAGATPSSTLASSAAVAQVALSNGTIRPAGKLVDNIRRQLMHDNYDYVYVESGEQEKSLTKLSSATKGSVSEQTSTNNKRDRTIKTAASSVTTLRLMSPAHRPTFRRVTFKEDEANLSIPIFPMNEGSLRYKAFEAADKVQGVTAGRQQKRKKSSESRIDPLINDLLYYIDDKHLRRNYLAEDTSDDNHHNNDDRVSDTDSGESNFYTTILLTTPKKMNGRLYKGYRQRSRMYGVHSKLHNVHVDYKKRKHKRPNYRYKGYKKHRQRNKQLRKSNMYVNVNNYNKDELIDDYREKMNDHIKDVSYNNKNDSVMEVPHTNQVDDQLDQELNNKNKSYDVQNVNQNETVYKDGAKEEAQPNNDDSIQDNNNAIPRSQYETSSDEHFYNRDDNMVDRRGSINEVINGMVKPQNDNNVDQVETTANVKYKLLKIPSGRGGRRSGSGALQLLQESGSTGVALWPLGALGALGVRDPAVLPQFRLPRARRQYMQERQRLRPALADLLPTHHRRHHTHHT